MSNDETLTLIVSVQDYPFKRAKEDNFYACPADYGRTRGDYVAFYRTSPKSSITHYAKVKEIVDDTEGELLSSRDKLHMIPNQVGNSATVFKLGEIKELEQPVENDAYGVQGAWFTHIDKLKSATKLSDLNKEV